MKKTFKKGLALSLSKGFTMIELLIVIAVLGILAVAVLSAINPIEQINRGRDTGSRSDSEQLLSAFDRYYTSQEKYPWEGVVTDDTDILAFKMVDEDWIQNGGTAIVLEQLSGGAVVSGTEELKKSFTNRISGLEDIRKLYVHMRGDAGDSAYVCFLARSGSFKNEANRRCSETGADTGDVKGGGLPADLMDAIETESICDPLAPYICLP